MSNQLNFYDMFDISTKKAEEVKKTASKRKEGKKGSTKKSDADKKSSYSLPLIMISAFGYYDMQESKEGNSTATENELKDYLFHECPYYQPQLVSIEKKKEQYVVAIKQMGAEKGTFSMEDAHVWFGSQEIDISSLKSEDTCTEKELTDLIVDQYPYLKDQVTLTYLQGEKEKVISVIPVGKKKLSEIEEPKENMVFHKMDGEDIEITKEEYLAALGKKREKAGSDALDILLSEEEVLSLLPQMVSGAAKMIRTGKDEYLLAPVPGSAPVKAKSNGGTKEQLYHIDGVQISLLFQHFNVTKDDFQGKTSVTQNELLEWLSGKGYPELLYSSVSVLEVQKANMIVVSISGSKKGSDPEGKIMAVLHAMENGESKWEVLEGKTYYFARHACFFAVKGEDYRLFSWRVKRIPGDIWQEAVQLCRSVYDMYGTEVLLDLYYHEDSGCYFWNVPVQEVRTGNVDASLDPFIQSYDLCGLIKVGQFHSHGNFPAFFSATDDHDEKLTGIYGVWGSWGRTPYVPEENFVIRVCLGEENFGLSIPDVFAETVSNGSTGVCMQDWSDRIFHRKKTEMPSYPYYTLRLSDGTESMALAMGCHPQLSMLSRCRSIQVIAIHPVGALWCAEPFDDELSGGKYLILPDDVKVKGDFELIRDRNERYGDVISLLQ